MSKRTNQNKVPMFLRLAFLAAKEADEEKARSYIDKAIEHGYQPNPKTERDLFFTLRAARRDRGLSTPREDFPGATTHAAKEVAGAASDPSNRKSMTEGEGRRGEMP